MMIVGYLHYELPLRYCNEDFDLFERSTAPSYRDSPRHPEVGRCLPSLVIRDLAVGTPCMGATTSHQAVGNDDVCGEARRRETINCSMQGTDIVLSHKCVALLAVAPARSLKYREMVSAHHPS